MELQEAGDHLCQWRAAIFRGCRRAQAASQRERSALSAGLDPTGKDCADLLEHELRRSSYFSNSSRPGLVSVLSRFYLLHHHEILTR